MAYKIRVDKRKEYLKEPPQIVSVVDRLGDSIRENARLILILAGTAVAVGFGIGAYWLYQQHQEKQALTLEYEARRYYDQQNPSDQAGDPPSKEENYRKAIELYQELIREYPNTRSGIMARFHIGNTYAELGEFESAISEYRNFLGRVSDDGVMAGLTHLRLAYVYQTQGRSEDSVQAFKSADSLPGALNKDLVQFELGRLNESLGKDKEAILHYQEIARRYPDSVYLADAQTRLNALGVTEVKPDEADKAGDDDQPAGE